jgi:hypothetical protein
VQLPGFYNPHVRVNAAVIFVGLNDQALVNASFKAAAKLALNRVASVCAERMVYIAPPQFQVRVHAGKRAFH